MTRDELDQLLMVAAQPMACDFPSMANIYVLVNGVEGLAPGAYRYDAGSLTLLRASGLRGEATRLALDQPAAGEAAVNIYFVAAFDRLLSELGERGYRAAQLEGGLRGGRLYLAATALGLRATGLTFYDDEVTACLSLPGDAAVLFLIALGR